MRNSRDFAEFISQQALREDEVMVSFDVVSLFTCVPMDLAVQIAYGRLEKDPTLPVSVVIANLVMEDFGQRALATFHSPPRFWKHYVDDTFTVLPCNLVQEFLSHLKNIEHASSSLLRRRQKMGSCLSWMYVCAESLTGLSLHQCIENQRTPTSTCLLTHTILWHTRPQW